MASAAKNQARKKWYKVSGPDHLGSPLIGEILAYSEQDLIGKTITMNLSNVSGDMRKQNTEVTFEVEALVDGVAQTRVSAVNMTETAEKRMVRKGRSKVTDSFEATTQDGLRVQVKPFIITSGRVQQSVGKALRKETRKLVKKYLKSHTLQAFYDSLINNQVQRELKNELSTVTPLRYVDIRRSHLIGKKR